MSPSRSGMNGNWLQSAWQGRVFSTAFVVAWSVNEAVRTSSPGEDDDDLAALPSTAHPVLVESIKLALSVAFYLWQRRASRSHLFLGRSPNAKGRGPTSTEEALPLNGLAGGGGDNVEGGGYYRQRKEKRTESRVPPSITLVLTFLAAVLFTYSGHLGPVVEQLGGSLSLYLATSAAAITLALAAFLAWPASVNLAQWQSVLMQFTGFWIIHSSIADIPPTLSSTLYPLLISQVFAITASFSLMEFVYGSAFSLSVGALHIVFFSATCALNVLSPARITLPLSTSSPTFSWEILVRAASQALLHLIVLFNIFFEGSVSTSLLLSYSAAAYLLGFSVFQHAHTPGLLLGSCIAIIACASYSFLRVHDDQVTSKPRSWPTRLIIILTCSSVTAYLALTTHTTVIEVLLSAPSRAPTLLDSILATQVTCHRKPLASLGLPHKRTYHAFDNVLLIVFFSHARYDVNLDYHHQVYSEFFPNIVYIGPGNRQDLGFNHSYDVMVDTYESDEDLSDPSFYKMAGRMAHHMLYTAMREHDCYDGYLWAPFDTLLNVPRLQQFDQSHVWYHSPFGTYVDNPALGNSSVNQNATWHAPPAKISPDPATNFTATWKHWGPDWWWGEPHVGVDVCMKGYEKVAPEMREHLATLTNGTRFIGGSADTLYVPGALRTSFLEVLGYFLETDCFLEIATPTALHLVSPPGAPILYVDHWWIWRDPLNATFVRNQWALGYEVDTFHTFHWGDRDENGTWRGNPYHVTDVQNLLKESALRQGIDWPYGPITENNSISIPSSTASGTHLTASP